MEQEPNLTIPGAHLLDCAISEDYDESDEESMADHLGIDNFDDDSSSDEESMAGGDLSICDDDSSEEESSVVGIGDEVGETQVVFPIQDAQAWKPDSEKESRKEALHHEAQALVGKPPTKRGLLRTFTSDSLRGANVFGFGGRKSSFQRGTERMETKDSLQGIDSSATDADRQKPHKARTVRGGRRSKAKTQSSEESGGRPSTKRGLLRTFTSDSLRGINVFATGGRKCQTTSLLDAASTDATVERQRPNSAKTRRGGRRNQAKPSTKEAAESSQGPTPARRGLLRTFTSDSLRGVNIFGVGCRKKNLTKDEAEPKDGVPCNRLDTVATVDATENRQKPHTAKTRRGGRRNQVKNCAVEPATPARRGLLRTFTSDSLRGANVFGNKRTSSAPDSLQDKESAENSPERQKPHLTKTRRGGRRNQTKQFDETDKSASDSQGPPLTRRGLLRTFTTDSLRGGNVFKFGGSKRRGVQNADSFTSVETSDSLEDSLPMVNDRSQARQRRGRRRNRPLNVDDVSASTAVEEDSASSVSPEGSNMNTANTALPTC